ncbi:MAG TPA: hypothetical protein VL225_13620 [Vicinamibacterales bacterium]|jgi:hypothetical protein|nr:hypothetical protein [Vicinamibacterales bacterium]
MIRLLERNIASIEKRLVLVAPSYVALPECFQNVTADPGRHQQLVQEMQRLRGSIYLQDGAVQQDQLTPDGLHRTPEDDRSWHLLMLNSRREVSSCAWYMEHDEAARFEHLRVRNCGLARLEGWRERLSQAVESELQRARQDGLRYAEVGGWAVAKGCRCTSEGLLLALAAYSLGRTLGGALGITMATVRHSSSTILRRLGGSLLEVAGSIVPPYYDPNYRCQMEILRFDSRQPSAKYAGLIELLGEQMADVKVIALSPAAPALAPAGMPDAFAAWSTGMAV